MARLPAELADELMRVAVICPYRLSVPGGVQTQVRGLAAALRPAAEVLVVAPGSPGDSVALAEGVGCELVGATLPIPVNGSRAPVTLDPLAVWRTRQALRAFRPDVVHIHEPFVPGPALAATLIPGAPVVATFHRAGATSGYRALAPALRPLLGRMADLVAVSEAARQTLLDVVGPAASRCVVIENAVDLTEFDSVAPTPNDGPTVLFLGRHEPRKGLAALLEAFARLPTDTRLWVGGDGPEGSRLRAAYASDSRISWLGALDQGERAARLAGADVFCAPSFGGESFGVVLLEAMAAGTAVVATDLPGYRLAGGDAVEYVPTGDVTELAARITDVLRNEKLRVDLVARGHRQAEHHAMSNLALAYLDRYAAAGNR